MTGFGSAFDRGRDGRGLARAIRRALAQAEVEPDAIDHVNANGLSTPSSDCSEAQGIAAVFGNRQTPVFAPKSYFGNAGAGSGVIELALSLMASQAGTLPATLNYDEPDPACAVNVNTVPHTPGKSCFLKVGFNEAGQCAAVVVRRWEGN